MGRGDGGRGISENVEVIGNEQSNPAGVAGGSGLFGGIIQSISSPFLQKWSQDYARHEAGQAWERGMESWRQQNEYNLPINEMQRLKDAGINPHLAYAKGGSPTAATGAPAGVKAAQPEFKWDMSGLAAGMQMLEKYQDIKIKQAQAQYAQPYNQYKTLLVKNNLSRVWEQIDLIKEQTENESWKKQLTYMQMLIQQSLASAAQEGYMPGRTDPGAGRIIMKMDEGKERDMLLNIISGIDGILDKAGKGVGIYQGNRKGGIKKR